MTQNRNIEFTMDTPLDDIIFWLPFFNAEPKDIKILMHIGMRLKKEKIIDYATHYCFNESGIMLKDKKQYSEALLCFDTALKTHPTNLDALVYKAEILYECKRYDEALQCCEIALTINRTTYDKYLDNQPIEFRPDSHSSARQILKMIHKHDDVVNNMRAKSLHDTARTLHRSGKLRESIKYYDDVLAMEPGNKIALLERMRILEELVVKLEDHNLECVAINAY